MTIEQIEKGNSILKMLGIWKERYSQYQKSSLALISIHRYNCEEVIFDGSGSDLSIRFFNEVELKYGELCKKQIELLEKELEAL